MQFDSDSTQRSTAKSFAIFSVWSPFLGFLLASILGASLAKGLEKANIHADAWAMVVGGLVAMGIAAGGLALAVLALAKTRSIGRRGVFGRALFGIVLNGVLLYAAACSVGAGVVRLGREADRPAAQHTLRDPVSTQMAARRLEQAREILQRMGDTQEGDAAIAAKASSEYLGKLRLLGDTFAERLAALTSEPVLDLSAIRTQEDLRHRELAVQSFIEANDAFGSICQNPQKAYRDELTRAGVSPAGVAVAVREFDAHPVSRALWDANRRWAQAQLSVLGFLQTHWGKWTYGQSKDAVEFNDAALSPQYQRLTQAVDEAVQELDRMRAKQGSGTQ